MALDILLVNKVALRAIRRGDLAPLLAPACGLGSFECSYAPGLFEIATDTETVEKLRRLAREHGLTVSQLLERLGTREIRIDEIQGS